MSLEVRKESRTCDIHLAVISIQVESKALSLDEMAPKQSSRPIYSHTYP